MREAAYDSLTRPAKQSVHGRIANVLKERFPELAHARPDLLAHHHSAAGRTRLAIPYAQLAAEQALRRCAYPEALAHTAKILEWAEELKAEERTSAILAANSISVQALMASRGWVAPQIKAIAEDSFTLAQKSGPANPHKVPMLWHLWKGMNRMTSNIRPIPEDDLLNFRTAWVRAIAHA